MQFEKQLPGERSPLTLVARRDARTTSTRYLVAEVGTTFAERSVASRPRVRSYDWIHRPPAEDRRISDERALRTSLEEETSWRAIPAAVFGLTAKAIAGLAAFGEVAFPGFLFAAMSWTVSQALAGCAAYAEAMYPSFVNLDEQNLDEHLDCRDPARGTQSKSGNLDRLPSQTSGLIDLSPIAKDEIRGYDATLLSGQGQFSGAAPVEAQDIAGSEGTRAAALGWSTSITSLLAKFRSRMRGGRDRRLAIMELRNLDGRSLRDMGISRCDIEYFARHGDRCE
jgi:uncharacterized protein YjiS (DUF1127 family)